MKVTDGENASIENDKLETTNISDCLNCFLNNDCSATKYYKYNMSGKEILVYLKGDATNAVKEKYTIKYVLNNVVSSNNISSIKAGETYNTKITLKEGFNIISKVKVTSSGEDITSAVYNNGEINIKNVSGDIVVWASAINQKENVVAQNTVYFDVLKGNYCTQKEYEDSFDSSYNDYLNSYDGYDDISTKNHNSCLKFYSFKETSDTRTMILDHNLTLSMWGNINEGPTIALKALYNSTKDWKGTITPEDYVVNQSDKTSGASYHIEYSKIPSYDNATTPFKARLITLEEVESLIKNSKWETIKSNTTNKDSNIFYLKNNGDETDYLWLSDRTTNLAVISYMNKSHYSLASYWTATISPFSKDKAITIGSGKMQEGEFSYFIGYGIRPVITVKK